MLPGYLYSSHSNPGLQFYYLEMRGLVGGILDPCRWNAGNIEHTRDKLACTGISLMLPNHLIVSCRYQYRNRCHFLLMFACHKTAFGHSEIFHPV